MFDRHVVNVQCNHVAPGGPIVQTLSFLLMSEKTAVYEPCSGCIYTEQI